MEVLDHALLPAQSVAGAHIQDGGGADDLCKWCSSSRCLASSGPDICDADGMVARIKDRIRKMNKTRKAVRSSLHFLGIGLEPNAKRLLQGFFRVVGS